LVQGLFARG